MQNIVIIADRDWIGVSDMNVLEKILEEIIDDLKEEGIIEDNERGHRVVEIIRSHMDEAKDTNVPSNDDWIPVE